MKTNKSVKFLVVLLFCITPPVLGDVAPPSPPPIPIREYPPNAHFIVKASAFVGKRQPNNSVSIGIGGTVAPEYPGGNVRMIARLSDGAVYLYQMTITGPNDDLFAGIPKLKNAAAGPATIILFPADNPDGINIIPIIIPK